MDSTNDGPAITSVVNLFLLLICPILSSVLTLDTCFLSGEIKDLCQPNNAPGGQVSSCYLHCVLSKVVLLTSRALVITSINELGTICSRCCTNCNYLKFFTYKRSQDYKLSSHLMRYTTHCLQIDGLLLSVTHMVFYIKLKR